jgi:hypothetical protein
MLTLRLDKIRAGARERPGDLQGVKRWPGRFPYQPKQLTTGPDGRFRITGLGPDQFMILLFTGPTIQHTHVKAMTRDSAPVTWPRNQGGRFPMLPAEFLASETIYGASFDYLIASSRPIRGVVRDRETRKPVAGAQVYAMGTMHSARTDKEGKYELLGCAKAEQYSVEVHPPNGSSYFGARVQLPDAPGLDALPGDVDLIPGIPCRGRLTDKVTGKPIAGARVEYHALFPNGAIGQVAGQPGRPLAEATTAADGTYTLAVLPRAGVLAFVTNRARNAYQEATVSRKELADLFGDQEDHGTERVLRLSAGTNVMMAGLPVFNYHTVVLIKPADDAKSVKQDATLTPSRAPDGADRAGNE